MLKLKIFSTIISILSLISNVCSSQSVKDTLFSYEELSQAVHISEMNSIDKQTSFFRKFNSDEIDYKDTASLLINFKSHGCMNFRKYMNGVLFFEGYYDSSDSFQVLEIQPTDPETDELLPPVRRMYFYPIKCGEWKFYHSGHLVQIVYFPKCNCL